MLLVESGRLEHEVDFERYRCGPGSVLHVRAGQVQRFLGDSGSSGWALLFTPESLPPTRGIEVALGPGGRAAFTLPPGDLPAFAPAMKALAALLRKHGLTTSRIGIEMDYLPAGDLTALRDLLPEASFAPAQALLARLREIKTPQEIDILRRLSRIADSAITKAYRSVRAGMSEMDLAAALTRGVYEGGAEYFKLMIVATGERSVFPNVGPTDRILRNGDISRVEIFPMISGYHAGVCRTAAVGTAPPQAQRIWANLMECKHLLLDAIKPGASTRRIYDLYLRKVGELGLPPISFIGHGIGLHLHEDPYLGPTQDRALEAGMVLGIEPLIYETGFGFGMQNKDMILVTPQGCELLSDYLDTDDLLIIG